MLDGSLNLGGQLCSLEGVLDQGVLVEVEEDDVFHLVLVVLDDLANDPRT